MAQTRAPRVRDRERGNDHISRLPNDVIHHIFSFIDTRFAVQSSLLSKKWRDTWKSHPYLNFGIDDSENHVRGQFPNFVHRFLSAHEYNTEISTIDIRSNSIRLPLLKEIVAYAMSHRTQELNIEFLGGRQPRRGGIDLSLFRSQFLKHFHLSIDLKIFNNQTPTWYLPALTTLTLERVSFRFCTGVDNSIELFSHFLNLKSLTLTSSEFSNDVFIIMSSKLETLEVIDCCMRCELVLSTPKLSSFTYIGMARLYLTARDLHSLVSVEFQPVYHRILQNQPTLVNMMIEIFNQLCKAKFLTLNVDALVFLSEFPDLLKNRPCPFTSLRSLTLLEPLPSYCLIMFSKVICNYFMRGTGVEVAVVHDRTPLSIRNIDLL